MKRSQLLWILACVTIGCGGSSGPSNVTVTSADSIATLTVPAAAVPAGVVLTQPTVTVSPLAGAVAGTTYDFGPSGTVFSSPATMGITFSPANLPTAANRSLIQLGTVVSGAWVPFAGTTLSGNVATAQISHFSQFGVLAQSMVGPYVLVSLGKPGTATDTCPGNISFPDGNTDSCGAGFVFSLNADGTFSIQSGSNPPSFSGTWSMNGSTLTFLTTNPSNTKDTFEVSRTPNSLVLTRTSTNVQGNENGEVFTLSH